MLSNRAYDTIKFLVQIFFPALGTLYFSIAQIWGLPYGEEILGTISALCLFGGALIKVSKTVYDNSDAPYDGTVLNDGTRDVPVFEFNEPMENLVTKNSITLKVDNTPASQ